MSKERLIQLQFALFFDSLENRPDKLIHKVDEALEGIFNEMPTIVPVPSEAPPEIPSVTMNSSNGVYVCNIARSRIDFIINAINTGDSISVSVDNFINKIQPFSEAIFSTKNIVRFGFVGRYIFKHTDPINKIQSKYLKQDLGELEEINLRYNKRFESNNMTFNDIVEISKGTITENNGSPQNGVVVMRDFNNIPVGSLRLVDMMSVIKLNENKFKLSGISELVL